MAGKKMGGKPGCPRISRRLGWWKMVGGGIAGLSIIQKNQKVMRLVIGRGQTHDLPKPGCLLDTMTLNKPPCRQRTLASILAQSWFTTGTGKYLSFCLGHLEVWLWLMAKIRAMRFMMCCLKSETPVAIPTAGLFTHGFSGITGYSKWLEQKPEGWENPTENFCLEVSPKGSFLAQILVILAGDKFI